MKIFESQEEKKFSKALEAVKSGPNEIRKYAALGGSFYSFLRDSQNRTLFTNAIIMGQETLNCFVSVGGAIVDSVDNEGKDSGIRAVLGGAELMKTYAGVLNARGTAETFTSHQDKDLKTALHYAAGDPEKIIVYAETYGSKFNDLQDKESNTPPHIAARNPNKWEAFIEAFAISKEKSGEALTAEVVSAYISNKKNKDGLSADVVARANGCKDANQILEAYKTRREEFKKTADELVKKFGFTTPEATKELVSELQKQRKKTLTYNPMP
jgi:hypothetical protein